MGEKRSLVPSPRTWRFHAGAAREGRKAVVPEVEFVEVERRREVEELERREERVFVASGE